MRNILIILLVIMSLYIVLRLCIEIIMINADIRMEEKRRKSKLKLYRRKMIPLKFDLECKTMLIKLKDLSELHNKTKDEIVNEYLKWIDEVEEFLLAYMPAEIKAIQDWRMPYILEGVEIPANLEKALADKVEKYIRYKKEYWIATVEKIGAAIDVIRAELSDSKVLRKGIRGILKAYEEDMAYEIRYLKIGIFQIVSREIVCEINKEQGKKFVYNDREYCLPKIKACRTEEFQYYNGLIEELEGNSDRESVNQAFSLNEKIFLERAVMDYKKMREYKEISCEDMFVETIKRVERRYNREKAA